MAAFEQESFSDDLTQREKQLLDQLKEGNARFLKFGNRGSPHHRHFRLSPDMTSLVWSSKWKSASKCVVDLAKVDRVQPGQHTKKFARLAKKYQEHAPRSFSIVYDQQLSTLDIVCEEVGDHAVWVGLLDKLVQYSQMGNQASASEVQNYKRQWRLADRDNSGTLDANEVTALVQRLNIDMNKKYIKKKIREVDDNGDGVLQFEEFVQLMNLLRARPDLEAIYTALLSGKLSKKKRKLPTSPRAEAERTKAKESLLPAAALKAFMAKFQGEQLTDAEVLAMIKGLEPTSDGTTITYQTFYAYMTSVGNKAMAPEKEFAVYQDMTQPLSHYYIASSHNTYLEGDQLQSNSSVNRYINDLCKGCRCVELDCWDGEDGQPVIFHGHTLTTKIKFKSVIEAVRDYAFRKSQYPVVLSLENHCSIPQQEIMAKNLVDILGDRLCNPGLVDGALPSPESLKGKVVLKGKVIKEKQEGEVGEVEVAEDDEEDIEDVELNPDGTIGAVVLNEPGSGTAAPPGGDQLGGAGGGGRHRLLSGGVKGKSPKVPVDTGSPSNKTAGAPKEHKALVAADLSRLTLLGGAKFKGFEAAKKNKASEMSSFSETKTEKLLLKSPEAWVEYNKRTISRIYPAGSRVDSSNYDPVPSWTVGSQLVALNYQTPGLPMRLNDGKYRDNGGCGWVLKPEALRLPDSTFHPETGPFPSACVLTVQVISAQQLPKPGGASRGEIIDPYVMLMLHGVPIDSRQKPQMTRAINDNGFNPVWDETFEFDVAMPELALLNLVVMDKDVDADDFIAYSVMPVSTIRAGYRTVLLFSSNGTRHGEFEHSSLFCRFSISNKS